MDEALLHEFTDDSPNHSTDERYRYSLGLLMVKLEAVAIAVAPKSDDIPFVSLLRV